MSFLNSLFLYKNFIYTSIKNDFFIRFAQSKLGALWMIINPLSQALIYALILSKVLGSKLPGLSSDFAYSLYLLAGISAWSLFSEIISRCTTLFIQNGNLLKKISFPRITLPAIAVGSCIVNFLLLISAVICVFVAFGKFPTFYFLYLIPMAFLVVILGSAIGLILGVFNVFLRDIEQVVPIILQMLFWMTPIVYPISIISDDLQAILAYNPLLPLVTGFQQVMVYDQPPDLLDLGPLLLISLVISGIALVLFRRASAEMVDVL
jgi:lipopolysaccharide transport system permease protein